MAALCALLWWADHRIDWVGPSVHGAERALMLAGVLAAAAAVYFGVLFACGFRPRHFTKKAF